MTTFNDFLIRESLGTGCFSNVYLVQSIRTHKLYVLKDFFWNASPSQVLKEVRILKQFEHPNISRVLTILSTPDRIAILFPSYSSLYFRTFLDRMTYPQIVSYMRSLLLGLSEIHRRGIIHRDIKPSNFLFDPDGDLGVIIDFGFACEITEGVPALPPNPNIDDDLVDPQSSKGESPMPSRRAGTRGFRAPEVLAGAGVQTPAIDIWSAGVILLSILTQRYPFFLGKDDLTNLCQIAAVVGGRRLREGLLDCERVVKFPKAVPEEAVGFHRLISALNPTIREKVKSSTAEELLELMLDPSLRTRVTAEQTLKHAFFRS
jgi:cell division control protein 7